MDPAVSNLPTIPAESADVFSLSDQVLSDRLEFIEEIGFGNWGSVWLCRPKPAVTPEGVVRPLGQKLAVKLVHRSKTSTTAARVKSLWNEMKIIKSFKADPHPSIIPFHSFIITPSYALITMTYLPTLVPVEVEESKARDWFRFLLSGVEFLHKRGVVHNDIKPANILVSHKNIPVLVDFGFAEKYDLFSDTAFHSNLSYGTPEYLSPERARGLPHDTRKSDVWSLGVTFFEILVGRTPFEKSDGEQFSTHEDLEKYWARTLRGKWVGTWSFSKGMEKLLQRMIAPNADLRCTAMQAIADSYWQTPRRDSLASHKRSSSYTSSIIFEKDMAKILNMSPSSWKTKGGNIASPSPPGLDRSDIFQDDDSIRRPALAKSKSQPKVAASKIVQPRKRAPVPPVVDLSPIKASPTSPLFTTATAKENILSFNLLASVANGTKGKKDQNDAENQHDTSATHVRRPFGALNARENIPRPASMIAKKQAGNGKVVKVFGDSKNTENASRRGKESANVRDRVRDWERERERLREMERMEEMERERDEAHAKEREDKERKQKERKEREKREEEEPRENMVAAVKEKKASNLQIKIVDQSKQWDWDKENIGTSQTPPVLPVPRSSPPLTQVFDTAADTPPPTRVTKETNKGSFRHSIKASIDKTFQLYKSSTLGQVTSGRSTPARDFSIDVIRVPEPSKDDKEAWEADGSLPEVSPLSPLPVIRNAAESERIAHDSRMDRMTIWMRNVEKVVEDAKQNFAASASTKELPLPPLPVPLSRNHSRASRLPRRVLAASQIFQADENGNLSPLVDQSMVSTNNSMFLTTNDDLNGSTPATTAPPPTPVQATAPAVEGRSQLNIPEIHTPSRQRRATVSTRSPEPGESSVYAEDPSKRKEKSKSHGNLFQMHIAPISLLEAELNRVPEPEPNPRLSQVIDRSLFIAPPLTSRDDLLDTQSIEIRDSSLDELHSSPCHVEPYPQRRKGSQDPPIPDTPSRHRIEGVYDRFLMATSGVKRLGKGYQSDNIGPISSSSNTVGPGVPQKRPFYAARKPMPPPVSSDDHRREEQRRAASVDELGMITYTDKPPDSPVAKEDGSAKVTLVRRAFQLMVPKATTSRRLSRVA